MKPKILPRSKRPPTLKQVKFVKHYQETGNATLAARKAGYSEKTCRQIGSQNLSKINILKPIDRALERAGLTEDLIADKAKEGVDAMETKFFQKDGQVVTEKEVIPWGVRLKYLEFTARMKGLLKEVVEHEGGDKPIEIRIVKRVSRKPASKGRNSALDTQETTD